MAWKAVQVRGLCFLVFLSSDSCSSAALSTDTRSPHTGHSPGLSGHRGCPGSRSRCSRNTRGPHRPSFGAALWLGCRSHRAFPFGLGRPRGAHPWQQCPTVPPRENGLWIEGDELDFMTLMGRASWMARWPGPPGHTTHFSRHGEGAQGRRPCVFFPCFK